MALESTFPLEQRIAELERLLRAEREQHALSRARLDKLLPAVEEARSVIARVRQGGYVDTVMSQNALTTIDKALL